MIRVMFRLGIYVHVVSRCLMMGRNNDLGDLPAIEGQVSCRSKLPELANAESKHQEGSNFTNTVIHPHKTHGQGYLRPLW